MSMYTHYYEEYCRGYAWVNPDSAKCGCRGGGWWLSDVDTWHKCPCHAKDAPHPEDLEDFIGPIKESEDLPGELHDDLPF